MEYKNSSAREAIAEWIHDERDRKIMERRLCDHVKFEALAEEFDMSTKQIKNIVYKLQERLFSHL